MADNHLLEEARAAINKVYREPHADPAEVLEHLEILTEDLEMYIDRLEAKLPQGERQDDGE